MLGFILLAGVVGRNYVFKNFSTKRAILKQEVEEAVQKQALYQQMIALQKNIDKLQAIMVDTADLSWLIDELHRVAVESGVEVVSTAPSSSEKLEYYEKAIVRVEVIGGYHAIGDFASRIESARYFMKVSNLRLEMMQMQKSDEKTTQLRALFTLGVFRPLKEMPVKTL